MKDGTYSLPFTGGSCFFSVGLVDSFMTLLVKGFIVEQTNGDYVHHHLSFMDNFNPL